MNKKWWFETEKLATLLSIPDQNDHTRIEGENWFWELDIGI
jgi:hypothetical protein